MSPNKKAFVWPERKAHQKSKHVRIGLELMRFFESSLGLLEMKPNQPLPPTRYSELRPPPPAGDLKRLGSESHPL